MLLDVGLTIKRFTSTLGSPTRGRVVLGFGLRSRIKSGPGLRGSNHQLRALRSGDFGAHNLALGLGRGECDLGDDCPSKYVWNSQGN